ncbi:MAG TPA: CUAEP/CCAEP-tail radical SAM protein [Anaerolineae bacterium]|nr:CUAEP/CCAEP-tail radical SAM protein [Anaerolineae bacterium]
MNVVLISTYELGHQPFGLASPAAWLKAAGAAVTCFDLAVSHLERDVIAEADLIAFYVPMHTATRIAVQLIPRIQAINPNAHLCAYGLYAPMNADYLRSLGVTTILGGEFEEGLVAVYEQLAASVRGAAAGNEAISSTATEIASPAFDSAALRSGRLATTVPPMISLARQKFITPDRSGLSHLSKYAYLDRADGCKKVVGYTETTRGCKHLCRHCPIVPVYNGQFRVVPSEVVLDDIEQQVEAGAGHITFGDPDFFNGPGHTLPIVEKLHQLWPSLTYDVTIKIEHLLKYARWLPVLRDTGCLFITSAVEAVDDRILDVLDKHHTRADFGRAVTALNEQGLAFNPTFVAFSPWISLAGYRDLLQTIAELELVDNVAPVQYAIRLLIPAGSKLLDRSDVQQLIGSFDQAALAYPWQHPDARVDRLAAEVLKVVTAAQAADLSRGEIFDRVWEAAGTALGEDRPGPRSDRVSKPIPHLSESWYC